MMLKPRLISISIGLLFTVTIPCIHAQIVLDGSLGASNQLSGPNYEIGAELGQQHGNNLFHSFDTFNLSAQEIATFSGSDNVENIINRVTGGSMSEIDGTLRSTIPDADFYLLNPAGVMFGENAVLDVQGSFHVSTANVLRFADGGEFHTDLGKSSSFSVAAPVAFGFLDNQAESISFTNSQLELSPRKTLSVVSEKIDLNNTTLVVNAGRMNFATQSEIGDIFLNEELETSSYSGELSLSSSILDVSGADGQGVFIRSGNIRMTNRSLVKANALKVGRGGKIDIAGEKIEVANGSQIISSVSDSGTGGDIHILGKTLMLSGVSEDDINMIHASAKTTKGTSGNISISVDNLTLLDGSQIASTVYEESIGGLISINAQNITINGEQHPGERETNQSGVIALTENYSEDKGKASSINITSDELTLSDGGVILSWSLGSGDAENIEITAHNIEIANSSLSGGGQIGSITSGSELNAGNAGNLIIKADNLSLLQGANISASSFNSGKAGNIDINVENRILISGDFPSEFCSLGLCPAGIFSASGLEQDSGDITINTKKLDLFDGAQLSSTTGGQGKAGNIEISAENIHISGRDFFLTGIFTNTVSDSPTALGGEIIIKTETLTMGKRSQISSSTFGAGNGGVVKIDAKTIELVGNDGIPTGIFSGVGSQSGELNNGSGGIVRINTDSLTIEDGARISAKTKGIGKGGDIYVDTKYLSLKNEGQFSAVSGAKGNAGNIFITATDKINLNKGILRTETMKADGGNIQLSSLSYLYMKDSAVTTSVQAENGNGGDIALYPQFVIMDNSNIIAQAYEGNGGNINISTTSVFQFTSDPPSQIDASSTLGIDGTVAIDTPEINLSGALGMFTPGFLSPNLMQTCTSRILENTSRFAITQHNVPPSPNELKNINFDEY